MNKKRSIKTRIFILIGFLLTGLVALAAAGSFGIQSMLSLSERMHDQGYGPASRVLLLHKHLYKLRGDTYKLMALPDEKAKIEKDLTLDLARIDSTITLLVLDSASVPDSTAMRIGGVHARIGAYQEAIQDIISHTASGDLEFGRESMKTGSAHKARKAVDVEAEALLARVQDDVTEIDADSNRIGHRFLIAFWSLAGVLLVLGIWRSLAFSNDIIRTIQSVVAALGRIGQGDFRDSQEAMGGGSEGARMSESLVQARQRLREAFHSVRASTEASIGSAQTLKDMSQALLGQADRNERLVHNATSASEQAAATMRNIAGSAASSMERLNSVSAAVEEMTASVTEIARHADETRRMTGTALSGTQAATQRMEELSKASLEIESVVEMIIDISEQIKLLALNASIEAARAGEAGKGFAVVANEVKELAKGTSEATEDIRKRVETMRTSTANAEKEIVQVSRNMESLGSNIHSIAGAVEEQSATTAEISRNIGEAARDTRESHGQLSMGIQAVSDMARDMAEILDSGRKLHEVIGQVESQGNVSRAKALDLEKEVGRFQID